MRLFLATDNGFILRRDPDGTYHIVFDVSNLSSFPTTHAWADYLLGGFSGHPEYCTSFVTYRNTGHKAPDRDEWITDPTQYFEYSAGAPPTQSSGMNWQTIVGPDGLGYVFNNYFKTGLGFTGFDLFKSTDRTLSAWTTVVADLMVNAGLDEDACRGLRDTVLEGDYFWWLSRRQFQPGNPTPTPNPRLCRMNLDGTGFTSWAVDWSPLDIDMVDTSTYSWKIYSVRGQWQTNRIIASSIFISADGSSPRHASNPALRGNPPLLTIDVSDPNTPTWAFSGSGGTIWEPWGGTDEYYACDIKPVTNTDVVAHVWHGRPPSAGHGSIRNQYEGAIHRSTDAGLTWTNITGYTRHLASARDSNYPPFSALFPHDQGLNCMQSIALQPGNYNEIAVANAAPYVWFSHDGGLTWEEETVPDSIYDNYLPLIGQPGVQPQGPPYNFTGIIWACERLTTSPERA